MIFILYVLYSANPQNASIATLSKKVSLSRISRLFWPDETRVDHVTHCEPLVSIPNSHICLAGADVSLLAFEGFSVCVLLFVTSRRPRKKEEGRRKKKGSEKVEAVSIVVDVWSK